MIALTAIAAAGRYHNHSLFVLRGDRNACSFPIAGKNDCVPRAKTPGGTRERFPASIGKPFDECEGNFDGGRVRASGRAIPAKLGGKNLGVVEYHHIAGPQKRG